MFRIVTIVAAALCVSAAPTQSAPDEMLNTPGVNGWSVYGPGQTHKLRRDKTVQGEGALRIDVATAAANPWDVGAVAPVTGAIAKDDGLLVAFWGRQSSEGTTEVPVFLQQSSAPFAPIVQGSVTLGKEWKLVSVKGPARGPHAAGTTNVVLHLGGAAHRLELGPIFVMRVK